MFKDFGKTITQIILEKSPDDDVPLGIICLILAVAITLWGIVL